MERIIETILITNRNDNTLSSLTTKVWFIIQHLYKSPLYKIMCTGHTDDKNWSNQIIVYKLDRNFDKKIEDYPNINSLHTRIKDNIDLEKFANDKINLYHEQNSWNNLY